MRIKGYLINVRVPIIVMGFELEEPQMLQITIVSANPQRGLGKREGVTTNQCRELMTPRANQRQELKDRRANQHQVPVAVRANHRRE